MQRVIKDDLGYISYVKGVAPKLTDAQKQRRFSFGIWARKDSISMAFVIDKMTEYELQVVNKVMLKVEFIEKPSSYTMSWCG